MEMLHEKKDRQSMPPPERIMTALHRSYYVDLNTDYRRSIVLAGTGRSGTTWVSEVINYRNDYRIMDEPYRNVAVPIVSHFNALQYIRPTDSSDQWINPARVIFSGQLRNAWTDRFNRKVVATRRLIKLIRANMFLKWIVIHFPEMPITYLMRHPAAVTMSQSRLDWDVDLPSIFLTQDELVQDYLAPHRETILGAQTVFEKRVCLWCVENMVGLSQLEPGDVNLAFYEGFCEEPETEFARMFAHYGMAWDDSVYEVLQRPSNTSKADSAIVTGKRPVDSWMSKITPEQRDVVQRMLAEFGMDAVYTVDSPWPNVEGARAMMKA